MKDTKIIIMYKKMHNHFLCSHKIRSNLYRKMIRLIFSCELPPAVVLADGVDLVHGGLGCVFHQNTKIGENTRIFQNVTIAGSADGGVPVIGRDCVIGCGAVIFGGVKIGNNVRIGANAVVLSDIPDNCTAVGVPAVIVRRRV